MSRAGLRLGYLLLLFAFFTFVPEALGQFTGQPLPSHVDSLGPPSASVVLRVFLPWIVAVLVQLLIAVLTVHIIERKFAPPNEPRQSRLSQWSIIFGGGAFASFSLASMYLPLLRRVPAVLQDNWQYIIWTWVVLGLAGVILGVVAYQRTRERKAFWGAALGSITLSVMGSVYLIALLEARLLTEESFEALYSAIVITLTCLVESVALVSLVLLGEMLVQYMMRSVYLRAQFQAMYADKKRFWSVVALVIGFIVFVIGFTKWYRNLPELMLIIEPPQPVPGDQKPTSPEAPKFPQLPPNSDTVFFFVHPEEGFPREPVKGEGILVPDPARPIVWDEDWLQIEVFGATVDKITIGAPSSTGSLLDLDKRDVLPYGTLVDPEGKPYPVGAVLQTASLYVNIYNPISFGVSPLRAPQRIFDESGALVPPNADWFGLPRKPFDVPPGTIYPLRRVVFIVPPGEREYAFTNNMEPRITFYVKHDAENKLKLELQLPGEGPDTTPPSAPKGLTVRNRGYAPWFELKWSTSTDNVGVMGYRIYRDGAPLPRAATTTTYRDDFGQYPTGHTYSVSAFDAAGNLSAPSEEVNNYSVSPAASSTQRTSTSTSQ